MQLDCQIGAKTRNILLFIDQCAAYPRDTTVLKNTPTKLHKPFATTGYEDHPSFQMPVRTQLIRKALAMNNGELLGDASKMRINLLTALHFIAEAWRQIKPTTIENC